MINIKYNCPESAEGMSATSCGKFCTSCQQEVYDFREKTIEEIIQIKSKNPAIKCGMFTPSQKHSWFILSLQSLHFFRLVIW